MSQKFPKLKIAAALMLAAASVAAFHTPAQPNQNSLYIEPCEVDYTSFNQVQCVGYIKINGIEYTASIKAVDYSYINDVDVKYTLNKYDSNEKAIYEELRAYFDDRRTFWIKEI